MGAFRCCRSVGTDALSMTRTPPWHLVVVATFRFQELSRRKGMRDTANEKELIFPGVEALGWGAWRQMVVCENLGRCERW